MRSHEWIDQRSLAMSRAIAAKVREDPRLLGKALATLERWQRDRADDAPAVLQEWHCILKQWPPERILALLASDAEDARRLRQSSPFCGILAPGERLAILRQHEASRT